MRDILCRKGLARSPALAAALLALLSCAARAAFADGAGNGGQALDDPGLDAVLGFEGTAASHAYAGIEFERGTHRNGVGIEGELIRYADVLALGRVAPRVLGGIPESLGFSAKAGARFSESDFGIPGEKNTGELHIAALYSLGGLNGFYPKYPFIFGNREHTLRFGYTGYLCTDSTSQVTGQLDYAFIKGRSAFLVNYENDTMLLYLSDKYRTAAFKLTYLYDLGSETVGVSAGFALWAGERKIDLSVMWNGGDIRIPEEMHRGRTVSLHNGRQYSLDVVYLSFIYGMGSLSFGYDSELFKKAIHNTIHFILNDGNIPIVDRPDRFFMEFRIGFPDDLF